MRHIRFVVLACAALLAPHTSFAAPLFSDDFNTAASLANYTIITPDATSSFATSGYDYGTLMGIPSAPSSGNSSTLGLRLDANNSVAPNVQEGITLLTKSQYSGDYVVTFDAWINVNGPFPLGGDGSTNYLTAGVGSDGVTNNFVANTGSGTWTAVNGDNGSGVDYRLYAGAALQGVAAGQYAAGTAANARNGENGYYDQFTPVNVANLAVQGANNGGPANQTGTSDHGSFGMAWHRVSLSVVGGKMSWTIDNLPIGALNSVVSGYVALGYSDPSDNASDNRAYSFALIDNLQIVPEPTSFALAGIGLLAMVGWRRRSR